MKGKQQNCVVVCTKMGTISEVVWQLNKFLMLVWLVTYFRSGLFCRIALFHFSLLYLSSKKICGAWFAGKGTFYELKKKTMEDTLNYVSAWVFTFSWRFEWKKVQWGTIDKMKIKFFLRNSSIDLYKHLILCVDCRRTYKENKML